MAYVPKKKSEFYDLLGWMVLRCPEYRSRHADLGSELAFQRLNEAISNIYEDKNQELFNYLLQMSEEAKRLSEENEVLKASQIFVDMERLMKGKELMYYRITVTGITVTGAITPK